MGCIGSKAVKGRDGAGAPTEVEAPRNDVGQKATGGKPAAEARFEDIYQLGKELGHGSFSTVREGVHKKTKRRYAVKCVKRADLPQEDEDDLKMEVELLQEMNHENIVKLYEFFEEKHFYYLVMEILNGGELFDRIVLKQYYNEKEARDVLEVLLKAIEYVHKKNVAHRDVKPENLLLVSEEDDAGIKLADFGFARHVGSEGLTTQCGTPGYVAPEILKGEVYGKPVDLWSIGVIMYILLGGYPPFHDDNQAKLYQKIKKGKVSFHPQYWNTVSDEAKDLIQRLLCVDKDKRITASDALKHAWMAGDAAELQKRDLGPNMDKLRLFNARRKFKSAIASVIMAQAMSNLTNAPLSISMGPSREGAGNGVPSGKAPDATKAGGRGTSTLTPAMAPATTTSAPPPGIGEDKE